MCAADHTTDCQRVSDVDLMQCRALIAGDWKVLDHSAVTPAVDHFVAQWAEFYLERPIHSLRLEQVE